MRMSKIDLVESESPLKKEISGLRVELSGQQILFGLVFART